MSLIGRDVYESAALLRLLARAESADEMQASLELAEFPTPSDVDDFDDWDDLAEHSAR